MFAGYTGASLVQAMKKKFNPDAEPAGVFFNHMNDYLPFWSYGRVRQQFEDNHWLDQWRVVLFEMFGAEIAAPAAIAAGRVVREGDGDAPAGRVVREGDGDAAAVTKAHAKRNVIIGFSLSSCCADITA